jgi:hypothetical protein
MVNASNQEVILRGVNLGGWQVQEGYMMKPGYSGTQGSIKKYLFSQGQSDGQVESFYQQWRDNFFTKADIDYLKDKGFNCVRLPLHYELFLTASQRAVRTGVSKGSTSYGDYLNSLRGWYGNNQLFNDPSTLEGIRLIDEVLSWVVWAVLGLAALNIGLSWFFQETAKDTKPYDAGELKKQIRQNLNIRHLWVRIKEMDGDKPGLTSLTLLTLLLTLNQGYLNYFIPYIGLGQLKLNPTQISYFFVFFGGLSAVANYIYFKYLLHKLDKKKVLIVAAWVGVALHILYANVHSSVLLLYLAAAADAISVSLIGGLLNGLVAQLSGEDDRGELFGITQALAGAASLVTTLVYGALSLVSLNAPFYWFALCMAVLAVMAMRLVLPPEPEGQGEAAPAPA